MAQPVNMDELTASAQLRMIVLPCSRCKLCYKIDFPDEVTVRIECKNDKFEGPLTEMVRKTRVCPNYTESLQSLRNLLKMESETVI